MRRPGGQAVRRLAGFTLLEVVVVITLLAVVAAVTVPALRTMEPRDDLDRATRDVVRLLRAARSTALDRGSGVTLLLDPGRAAWWIDRDSAGMAVRVAEGTFDFPEQVSLSGQTERLVFRFEPTGRTDADSFFVRSSNGSARIRVDPWNGEPDVR